MIARKGNVLKGFYSCSIMVLEWDVSPFRYRNDAKDISMQESSHIRTDVGEYFWRVAGNA